MQSKVKLKSGEQHCLRCSGYQLFYVRVHNGKGVPAQPADGICYRCHGTGVEPPRPFFTEFQKQAMCTVFEVLYQHLTVNLNISVLVQETKLSSKVVEKAIYGLRLCGYVYEDSLIATELGVQRFSQLV